MMDEILRRRAGTRFPARVAVLLIFWFASPALAQHQHAGHDGHGDGQHDATSDHTFEKVEQWAAKFEDPDRDRWQEPEIVLELLIDRDDLIIADIGSATGYFPVKFAPRVPNGHVYGADIEPGMVMYLNDRARREGIPNLTSVLAAPEDPHLPRAVDLVFICNTYHHINSRLDYLGRLKEQLRDGARVAIVDFRLESTMGPNHKLDPDVVAKEFTTAGFTLVGDHDTLPEQYLLVFQKR